MKSAILGLVTVLGAGVWAGERPNVVLIVCFLIMAGCLFVMALGGLALWILITVLVIAGLMRGLYNASRDILVRRAAPKGSIGTAFAFVTLGYTFGQGGMPVVYGWLMDSGLGYAVFIVSGVAALLAIVIVLIPDGRQS